MKNTYSRITRRSTLALVLAATTIAWSATVHAQRVADTLGASFDTRSKPVDVTLDKAKGEKVEVRQFFGYWCPHCANLEPVFNNWARTLPDSYKVVRTPVAFDKRQAPLARMYYVLESLPKANELHQSVFNAIHRTRILSPAANQAELKKFATAVLKIDAKIFDSVWSSKAVDSAVVAGDRALTEYNVEGVPVFFVQGKYSTSMQRFSRSPAAATVKGHDALAAEMFKAIERAASSFGS